MAEKPKLTPFAILVFALLAASILFLGHLALAQFTPKCVDACPSLLEKTLRAITVVFAGMMVLAGAGWWIVFNIITPMRRARDEAAEKKQ